MTSSGGALSSQARVEHSAASFPMLRNDENVEFYHFNEWVESGCWR